jgi:muramoyltetrapeptide carboxypeptidase
MAYSPRSGTLEGKLLGGNDWVMQWLLGTSYFPDFSDSVLFIEAPGSTPYMPYNRLYQFKQAGLLDKIKGISIGYAKDKNGFQVEDIFTEVTAEYDFSLVKTDDFGHNCPNTTLPSGTHYRLDADIATFERIETCV